jgi:hypothetical protein
MSQSKHGLKVFGLSVAVALSLMASITASAQAFTWDINSTEITADKVFEGTLEAGTEFLLLVTLVGQAVVVHCNNLAIDEGTLFWATNTAHGKLLLTGCVTLINGKAAPTCNPPNNAITMKVKFKPILHNAKVYLLFEPLAGAGKEGKEEAYVTLFEEEEKSECALAPTRITGTYVMQCFTGALVLETCAAPRERQQVTFAPTALFTTDVLRANGTSVVTLDGEFAFTLNVAGKTWNALL